MKKIIFVDDDLRLLSSMKRTLRGQRRVWDMIFLSSGALALAELNGHKADLIVSDMRMPEMDGAELLAKVRRSHPQIVRICLTGYSGDESILRALSSTHACFTKPTDREILVEKLESLLRAGEGLPPQVRTKLCGRSYLPCLESTLVNLEQLLDNDCEPELLFDVFRHDIGACTKLLKAAHSGFFGHHERCLTIEKAVRLLGPDRIKVMIFQEKVIRLVPDLDPAWLAALQERAERRVVEAARMAQMEGLSIEHETVLQQAARLFELGNLALGETWNGDPKELTSYLVELWGLPSDLLRWLDRVPELENL